MWWLHGWLHLLVYKTNFRIGAFHCMCVLVTQLCPTLCDPMDCSSPGSSVYGDSPGKNSECVAIHFSRVSSQPRDQIPVSYIAGRFFYCLSHQGSSFHYTSSVQLLSRVQLFANPWTAACYPSPTPGVCPNSCPLSQ